MHVNYPAVSIHKEKIHVHRLLMMYWLGNKLPSNYFVHHIDENKLNALQENLSIVFASMHQSKHNKGKTLSTEHKRKIGIKNHNRAGIKQKKQRPDISVDTVARLYNEGMSINKISITLNCDWSTIKARLADNPELLTQSPTYTE